MGHNKSPIAFDDCRAIMNRALASERGIEIECGKKPEAFRMRARCYEARSQDREASKKIYQPDDPQYGQSAWDRLVIRLDGATIRVEKITEEITLKVKEL